jgi:hypothetical protein
MKIKSNKMPLLAKMIIEKSDGKLRFGSRKRGALRIQLADISTPVSAQELEEIAQKAGIEVLSVINPGTTGAASAKFNTYVMRHKDKQFMTVFGCGKNKGHSFEDDVLVDLNNGLSAESGQESLLFNLLLNSLKCGTKDNIKSITKASGARVRRPFSTDTENIGEIISDLNVNFSNNETAYVSLKNVNGFTLANVGYKNAFETVQNQHNQMFVMENEQPLDHFVNACGVSKKQATIGLNDYIQHSLTENIIRNKAVNDYDKETIKKYLSSAFGFGYWYIKLNRKTKGGYQIVNIGSKDDAAELVGDINQIVIDYPYWTESRSSKQITIKISTTTMDFNIEIRNSQGKLIPDEIKIRTLNIRI